MFRLLKNPFSGQVDSVVRINDNACIPFDEANTDYQAYLKYVAEGGAVLPADEGTN